MAYLSSVDDYIRFEELASGKGYIDLLFLPALQSSKPALIIELKWNKSAEKSSTAGTGSAVLEICKAVSIQRENTVSRNQL